MRESYITLKIGFLLSITVFLTVSPIDASPDSGRGLLIEDRTKMVSFRVPEKWSIDKDSNQETFIFNGPSVLGIKSKLTVRNLLEGRPYPEAVNDFMEKTLKLSSDENVELENVEGVKSTFLEYVVRWEYKERAKKKQIILALGRNGPYMAAFTFDVATKGFEQYMPDVISCLSSAGPWVPQPVYSEMDMGLSFYYLPSGFEVDEDNTKSGKSVVWKYEEDGVCYSEIYVEVLCEAITKKSVLDKVIAKVKKEIEENPKTKSVKESPYYLSGLEGVLFEHLVEYEESKNQNTRWEIYIQNSHHLILLYCDGETETFNRKYREIFSRFMRSIDIAYGAEKAEE